MIVWLALIWLLAFTGDAAAVPAVVAAILAAAGISGSTVVAGTLTVAQIATAVVTTAISVGLSFLLQPKPDDGGGSQVQVKQAKPPRMRGYGRVKLGAAIALMEVQKSFLHQVLVHCEGPIDAIEQYWLNDKNAFFSGGAVKTNSTFPWVQHVVWESKLGALDQTACLLLRGGFDAYTNFGSRWTADHRLRGLAYTVIRGHAPGKPADFGTRFPNGMPSLRIVARLVKVYDPRNATTAWSDNAALCILDYLTHPRGYAIASGRIDMASFSAFANVCDQAITLKAGGTEKRYRLGGTYDMTEQPREVLRRLLQTCDAEVYMTAAGKVAIRGGRWEEPTVTITEHVVISYTYEQGSDKMAKFNRLSLSFVSPDHDYQPTETEAWEDLDDQGLTGEVVTEELALAMVQSHAQARRLAKIATHKANPRHKIQLVTNLGGLNALGERIIRLQLPEVGIDDTFSVSAFTISGDMTTCTMDLSSLSIDAYSWDPATEEGDPPPVPQSISSPFGAADPPDVAGLLVVVERVEVTAGVFNSRIVATVDPTDDDAWTTRFEYRKQGSSTWLLMSVGEDAYHGVSGTLEDGATYEVRAAHSGTFGRLGDYSATETIVATADPTAPASPGSLSTTVDTGTVTVSWVNPNSANYYATRVYRGTTGVFADATLLGTRYGSPNLFDSFDDVGAPLGSLNYWVTAINASGVASAEAGPETAVVT